VLGSSTPSFMAMADRKGSHTALVHIDGMIADDRPANADAIKRALQRALENPASVGVVLAINSPGGSPVQSDLAHQAIRQLRKEFANKPVHAVLGDVAASGGYYIAAAAENIYANRASIVGSIGVRIDSFGAEEAMQKLGIERRLLTAGEHKGLLDPFLPVDEVAEERLQALIDGVHQQFIDAVQSGRGERIADDPSLYTGLVWSGNEALDKGLIDGIESIESVAKELFGAETIIDYTQRPDALERLTDKLAASLSAAIDSRWVIGW